MPSGHDPEATLPSLAAASWLTAKTTQAVFAALAARGHAARVVGGAVRNTLMGLAVTDIDIATTAVPDEVVAAAKDAGLACVPTGLAHGTVTVIAGHVPYEVTTLRHDVATDGRRATVAFTDDWQEDARRRDFTMNALYCDASGAIHDPVGGYSDILARRVRFIGNADRRIAEDYLRILRFFRFHATYAAGPPDPVAMAAAARGMPGMARLSAERIRAEMVKLLVAPRAGDAIDAMMDIGLLSMVLGSAPRPALAAAVMAAEDKLGLAADAMLRLSALAVAVEEDRCRLARRLRLSQAERRALLVMGMGEDTGLEGDEVADQPDRLARRLVYRLGAAEVRRRAAALVARHPNRKALARRLIEVADDWLVPRLPITGAELGRKGVAPGPEMGRILSDLEAWWIANDFPSDQHVIAELDRTLSSEHD